VLPSQPDNASVHPAVLEEGREDKASARSYRPQSHDQNEENPVGRVVRGQVIGQYEIVERVGCGGFGGVYKGRDVHLDKIVAIKALILEDPSALKKEAQVLSDLRHENIVGFRHLFAEDGEWYLVMDFVDGGNLADLISSKVLYEGGVERALRRMLSVGTQFAEGLACAHKHGVVHQDIKPANVLITPQEVVKVADFGLAKARAVSRSARGVSGKISHLVSSGGMTPAYCSPEQLHREPLSNRTDTWSWGLSILQMFKGGIDWLHGSAAPEVFKAYVAAGPPTTSIPLMPQELTKLLSACFSLEPGKRPAMQDAVTVLKTIDPAKAQMRVTIAKTIEEKEAVVRTCATGERFAVVGNGTVIDTNTNLMWAARSSGRLEWSAATRVASEYKGGGYPDWRLPTPGELQTLGVELRNTLHIVFDLRERYTSRTGYLWSSKSRLVAMALRLEADCLDIDSGKLTQKGKGDRHLALPVRSIT